MPTFNLSKLPDPIQVMNRIVVDHQKITVPITTGVTLASLCTGGIIPPGAVAARIQCDGGVARVRLAGALVAPTTGDRLDDGVMYAVDSDLTTVSIVAAVAAVSASAVFFDRV